MSHNSASTSELDSINISDGKWEINHKNNDFRLLTFEIRKGIIVNIRFSAHLMEGIFIGCHKKVHIQIIRNTFVYTQGEEKDSSETSDYLKFILEGTFDSETTCHGILNIPEGYFDTDEHSYPKFSIPWDAELSKSAP
jgi:hypothetical protein